MTTRAEEAALSALGRNYIQDTLPGIDEQLEITHACPTCGTHLTPCCGRSPFELRLWKDRITLDKSLVNCKRSM